MVNRLSKSCIDITLPADLRFTSAGSADTTNIYSPDNQVMQIFILSPTKRNSNGSFDADFRIKGKLPELWDPVTGKMKPAGSF